MTDGSVITPGLRAVDVKNDNGSLLFSLGFDRIGDAGLFDESVEFGISSFWGLMFVMGETILGTELWELGISSSVCVMCRIWEPGLP